MALEQNIVEIHSKYYGYLDSNSSCGYDPQLIASGQRKLIGLSNCFLTAIYHRIYKNFRLHNISRNNSLYLQKTDQITHFHNFFIIGLKSRKSTVLFSLIKLRSQLLER